ncbi:hypothetical protein [Actinoplanes rectilineatus]|uniref:hypothetical protein n=1 Tax=Actinoplanes rectilineatus TaxID=113571 RepID=UPI0005F2B979|nr:hypothetical protein [Actinoplanes rectilineatus]
MVIFPGWRLVGLALRWARRQADIHREAIDDQGHIDEWVWRREGVLVALTRLDDDTLTLTINLDPSAEITTEDLTALQMLQILGGLALVPREIAHAPDEIYARCVVCRGLAVWADGHEFWHGRWTHLAHPGPDLADWHLAIPAQADGCRCTWLGVGTPAHERSGLCLPEVAA